MYFFITSFICIIHCTYGITIDKDSSKSAGSQDKRSLLIGDLSYSYAATDIGSDEGSHIKTITVIKNIAAPTFKKSHHHQNDDESSWDNNSKNRFNFVFKLPEFPHIDTSNFFHKDKPKRVIPTKQPTDRQTPVIDIENDDQPDINTNIGQNVPQVYDISEDENSSEPLPNPMTLLNTEGNNGQMENTGTKEASDDTEYIQMNDDNLPPEMAAAQMFHSQKEHTFRIGKFKDNSNSNGRPTAKQQKQLQNQRHSTEFLEDFSDYSMHNVRHLNDPVKTKDSLLKYTQNHPNGDSKQFSTPVQSNRNDQKYDSYGNVIEKSQSILDASQDRRTLSYSTNTHTNVQPSKRPYISPSIQKAYVQTSTVLPVTQSSNVKVEYATTPSKNGVRYFSTTQRAYVAPKKLKSGQNIKAGQSFVKPSMESIQEPMFKSAIQLPEVEYQQKNNHFPPNQQFQNQESNQQQYKTYSIRNPLTTSLPVQHNNFKQQKTQNSPKMQSYIAVPIEANTQSSYRSESSSKEHLSHLPKRFVRHHIVFNSKPPYPFMESPFKPVKATLMG